MPTYWQLHVPFLMYMSDSYAFANSELRNNALKNRYKLISSSKSFAQTLLQLAGVNSEYFDRSLSLISYDFGLLKSMNYLNELNESVDLFERGLCEWDRQKVKSIIYERGQ